MHFDAVKVPLLMLFIPNIPLTRTNTHLLRTKTGQEKWSLNCNR